MSYPNEPSRRTDPSSTAVRGTDGAGEVTDPRRAEYDARTTTPNTAGPNTAGPNTAGPNTAGPNTTTGATRVAERKGGGGRWLLVLLGLVVLALLAWGLSQCGNNSARPTAPPPAAAPQAEPGPAVPDANAPAGAPGSLTVGDRSLFPLAGVAAAGGSLGALAGQDATARGVRVLSVPADEGFWAGADDSDRVWVKLIPNGESPIKVRPGELLDFTGAFVAHDSRFAGAEGVDAAEGGDQLTGQGAHIEAPQDQVRVIGNG